MRRIALLMAVALLLGGVAAAQTTGAIEGRIVDENNAPLPGVTVEARSPNLQGSRMAVTDADGDFRLPSLPPGRYNVRFTLQGFATQEQANVNVGLGRTVTLEVQMRGAFEEEVVVSGAAPTIDVRSTEIGTNVQEDLFLKLPTGRNYSSVVQVTPGAVSTDSADCPNCISVYGSSGAENAYYIDGVNTTGVELATQGKQLNFEFIQEVQVKTGGYQAEFGRATGGLINVITKSGGNEFHGDVFAYYDAEDLRADVADDVTRSAERVGRSYLIEDELREDYGFDLGGYIVQDRLWFFAAYDHVNEEDDRRVVQDFTSFGGPDIGDTFTSQLERDLWAAKLTWRPAQNHTVFLTGFGDPTDVTGPDPNRGLAGPTTSFIMNNEEGGSDGGLKYEGVFGTNWILNAQVMTHNEENIEGGPGEDIIGTYDYTSPIYLETGVLPNITGGYGFYQQQEFGRDVYRADVSYFLNDFGGDHELKVGAEFEDISVANSNFQSGGQRIYAFENPTGLGGDTYYRHRFFLTERPANCLGGATDPSGRAGCYTITNDMIMNPLVVDTKSENLAAYVQDTWRMSDNFTVNLGLRWEEQALFNAAGEEHQTLSDQWAPRFGFVWDWEGDGTSKLYGSWGRFYETIPMDIVIRSYGGEITAFFWNFNGAPTDPSRDDVFCDPALDQAYYEQAGTWRCSITGGGFSPVDPDTKGQYIDEAIIGAEYEVWRDVALGVKLIYRDLGRVMEDALNAQGEYFIGNPGEGLLDTSLDMSYQYAFPVADATREFRGAELTVRKRFSANWQMIASYLYSELEGNYDGTFQASTGQLDPNLNSAFDYAEFQVNNDGYLSNDRRHQFKVDGYYTFPFGLNLGLSAYYRTGTPITAMGYSEAYHNWEFYLSRRGAFGRTDDEWEADLHLGYPISVGGVEVNVIADIFNLLDRQGQTGVVQRYNLNEIHPVIDYETGAIVPAIAGGTPCTATPAGQDDPESCNPAFGVSDEWQDPRSIRLGLRVTF